MKYGLSESTVGKICAVFSEYPAIERAVLYGSRAKGNFKPASDIDLTLYGASLTAPQGATIADALDELLLPYEIDLSLFDSLDSLELRQHVARVGVVFYQRTSKPDSAGQTHPIPPSTAPTPSSHSR